MLSGTNSPSNICLSNISAVSIIKKFMCMRFKINVHSLQNWEKARLTSPLFQILNLMHINFFIIDTALILLKHMFDGLLVPDSIIFPVISLSALTALVLCLYSRTIALIHRHLYFELNNKII
jgi:hypothetical protein